MKSYSFEGVWPSLEAVLCRLHANLLDAIDNANRMEEVHPELVSCPIQWAGHVRAYLARSMPGELDPDDFYLEKGFNVSLTLHGERASIRVLKAPTGKLPEATGVGRQRFFGQIPPPAARYTKNLFDAEELGDKLLPLEHACNFVAVWGTEGKRLVRLDLAYPKPVTDSQDELDKWYWVTDLLAVTAPAVFDNEPSAEESDSLGLERRDDDIDATGTDNQ